jgi:hypothetical protein
MPDPTRRPATAFRAAAGLLLVALVAFAADAPPREPDQSSPITVAAWTGFISAIFTGGVGLYNAIKSVDYLKRENADLRREVAELKARDVAKDIRLDAMGGRLDEKGRRLDERDARIDRLTDQLWETRKAGLTGMGVTRAFPLPDPDAEPRA